MVTGSNTCSHISHSGDPSGIAATPWSDLNTNAYGEPSPTAEPIPPRLARQPNDSNEGLRELLKYAVVRSFRLNVASRLGILVLALWVKTNSNILDSSRARVRRRAL